MEEIKKDVNEFEDVEEQDDAPEATFSNVGGEEQEDVLAKGQSGTEYDFNKAPDTLKAPPRINMDGQETTITDAKIILPRKEAKWELSRDKETEYKYCVFKLFYENGQQEFYSGVRVFKVEQGGDEKYSHPSIMRDRKNQSSQLLGRYADFKNKDINEVSLKEFLSYLKSKPKVRIKVEEFENPNTGDKIHKNMVNEFL